MTGSGPGRIGSRLRPPDPRWIAPPAVDEVGLEYLTAALKLPRALCAVLAARGQVDADEAKRFLRPRLDMLPDATLLADGEAAAARIASAVRSGEMIFVHGDYDVDGICATALLTRWLRGRGGRVTPFVPHRLRDGYDFTAAGLDAAVACGAALIITVDCGSVAHETVKDAVSRGIDVIVTDHHTIAGELPAALAVVNPQRADCAYPDKGLCGAGLAWKLAWLTAEALGVDPETLYESLDLVALATVADLVPLKGENRVLVHFGLRRFAESPVAGIRALLARTGVDGASITSGQIGFVVAPRINAAGRIGESADALRLLLTDDDEEAAALASRVDEINTERRDEDQRTLEAALDQLERSFDAESDFGVVIAGEGWHPGVIGIVASRVVERIHRPVVMLALDTDKGRGSARSIPGFHLYDALAACAEHLGRFGGHRQAAGMDIDPASVPAFRSAFNEEARGRLAGEDLRPVLRPDVELALGEIDLQLIHWLGYLGPHGMGNAGPLFRVRSVRLDRPRVVGSNHLKVTLVDGGTRVEAIGFGLTDRFPPDALGDGAYDALVRLERNEYRGRITPQAKLVDLRAAES